MKKRKRTNSQHISPKPELPEPSRNSSLRKKSVESRNESTESVEEVRQENIQKCAPKASYTKPASESYRSTEETSKLKVLDFKENSPSPVQPYTKKILQAVKPMQVKQQTSPKKDQQVWQAALSIPRKPYTTWQDTHHNRYKCTLIPIVATFSYCKHS